MQTSGLHNILLSCCFILTTFAINQGWTGINNPSWTLGIVTAPWGHWENTQVYEKGQSHPEVRTGGRAASSVESTGENQISERWPQAAALTMCPTPCPHPTLQIRRHARSSLRGRWRLSASHSRAEL